MDIKIKSRKLNCLLLSLLMLASLCMPGILPVTESYASSGAAVAIDGVRVNYNGSTGYAFIENGVVFAPAIATSQAYGAKAVYDQTDQTVSMTRNGVTVKAVAGDTHVYRNGIAIKNSAAARVSNGILYVPVKAVFDAFGANVTGSVTTGSDGIATFNITSGKDRKLITEIESGAKISKSSVWSSWNKAIEYKNAGNYSEALNAFCYVAPAFLDEGNENAALLFERLAECYIALKQYNNASVCYYRSAYYWGLVPLGEQDQTSLAMEIKAKRLQSDMQLYLKTNDKTYSTTKYYSAPYEPQDGILLGAYAEGDPGASNWNSPKTLYFYGMPNLTGKDHGVYLLYMKYETDVAHYQSHFMEAAQLGKVMQIALEPNKGLDYVMQNPGYITELASYLEKIHREYGCKFLLRFANEMNDPSNGWYSTASNRHEKYVEAFRLVSSTFKKTAPSVGIVWAPNWYPQTDIEGYYPGDSYVDYVGVSAYEDINPAEKDPLGDGIHRERWIQIFEDIYTRYGHKKPIILSEGGCAYANTRLGLTFEAEAAYQIKDFYTYLPIKYPNVKMAVLFDSERDVYKFVLSKNAACLNAYKQGIATSARYLSDCTKSSEGEYYGELFSGYTLPGEEVELCSFVASVMQDISYVSYSINGKEISRSGSAAPYNSKLNLTAYQGKSITVKAAAFGSDGSVRAEEEWQLNIQGVLGEDGFYDVNESDWFYNDVVFAVEQALFMGTSDNYFSPSTGMTRGMLVTVLWRNAGSPYSGVDLSEFTDLKQDWYREAVNWASVNGIVNGVGKGLFSPDSSVTREQLAAILYRYAIYMGYNVDAISGDITKYEDYKSVGSYAVSALSWANGAGLITGRSETLLAPKGTASRAEVAAIFRRFQDKYKLLPS